MRLTLLPLAALAVLAVATSPLAAQEKEARKSDSTAMKGHDMKGMKHDMKGMQHDMGDHAMSPWKEMDAFHATLAGTYHPAADKGDLAPLKAKAGDLAAKAKAWAASTAPKACANEATKGTIVALADSASALAQQVSANASNEALTTAISSIHTKFETVEMACAGKGGMQGMKH